MERYIFQDGKTTSGPFIKYLIYDPYPEGDPGYPQLLASVILPMPGGLEFNNQANYEESGDVVSMMVGLFGGTIDNLAKSVETGIKGKRGIGALVGAITSTATDPGFGKTILSEGMDAAKTLSPILGRPQARKKKINEYAEHMFEGVPFRSFTFTHTLVPNNQEESVNIQTIIKRLQLALAPAGDGAWFTRPQIIRPQFFIVNGRSHPYIPDLEFSVIKSCAVNYAPQEPFHQHIDGAPTQITISIEIEEMIPITQERVQNPGSGEIISANRGKEAIDRFMKIFKKEQKAQAEAAAKEVANAQSQT